jgi:hypothetical protein
VTTNILRHPETEHITVHLLPDDIAAAERALVRFANESLSPDELADELTYWRRQRTVWLGDVAAQDFTDCDEPALLAGISYAEHRLAELARQAERQVRAMQVPGYPPARPGDDLTPRFRAARYVDLVSLVETLTGEPAIKSGSGRYRVSCPWHDDRRPSLILYPPGKGWWCPVCHKGGDAVAFVAELKHCTAVEALRWVETLSDTYPAAWQAAP